VSSFHKLSTGVILANTGLLIAPAAGLGPEELLDHVEMACWLFFWLELGLRMRRERWGFFRSPWSVGDLVIMTLSGLPMLGSGMSILRVARLARVFHLGRHWTHLRLLRVAAYTAAKAHWRVTAQGVPLVIGKASCR
jgi:hypothetical protein